MRVSKQEVNFMWNVQKYKEVIRRTAKDEIFTNDNGKKIKTREELYCYLGQKLYMNHETVKSWSRVNSKGPGEENVKAKLETLLGVSFDDNEKEREEENIMVVYSEFVKGNIMGMYNVVRDYITEGELESEELYCEMCSKMDAFKIGVPKKIYELIKGFVDKELDPIIYDNEYWADLHSSELGSFNEEGIFCLKDENATRMQIGRFLEKVFQIEKRFEEFGMKELYPILVS
jgi:hypothetical protein